MKEEGFFGSSPALGDGHLIIYLPVEVFPIQVKWRGEEGPESLLQVAYSPLKEPHV